MSPFDTRCAILRNGYIPTPCAGKAPVLAGWQKKTETNGGEIHLWDKLYPGATNTGILTERTPGLDIDVKLLPAAEAIEALAREEFEERGDVLVRIGQPPKRLIPFRTDEPFGKLKRIFTAPDGSTHALEFLGKGQQAICVGIHPDTGKPYSWRGGTPWEIYRDALPYIRAEDADGFLDKAARLLIDDFGFVETGAKTKGNGAAPDGEPHDRADWPTLIRNIHDGIDLHDSMVRLAAAFISSGMDEHGTRCATEALFLTSDTPRDERWRARWAEIPRAVRSAYEKYARAPREPERIQPTNLPSGEELKAMHFEPIKYVVRGIIVEGLTLLAAKPKIGKSWLMLHVAIAVARGGFTLGEIHCEEGDVLYCALEDNLRRLKSRMSKLLGMDIDWPKRLRFVTEMPRLADGGLDVIREWIKSAHHPRLVIIDTLAMVRAPKKRDESSYDADYAAVKELRALAAEHGVAIVLIHHLRKADSDDAFDTVSGTLGLTGAPDTILVLKRDTSGTIILHGRGRDLIEIEKAMAFNKDACTWTMTGEASQARTTSERQSILDAVREIGEPATSVEIAGVAQLKPGNVRRLLVKMVSTGLLKKAARGRYMPADAALVTDDAAQM